VLSIKGYEPEKNLPDFQKKGGMPPKSQRSLIKNPPSGSSYQRNLIVKLSGSFLQKFGILYFFSRKKDPLFFSGGRIELMFLEHRENANPN
jgi:hypothetical protein